MSVYTSFRQANFKLRDTTKTKIRQGQLSQSFCSTQQRSVSRFGSIQKEPSSREPRPLSLPPYYSLCGKMRQGGGVRRAGRAGAGEEERLPAPPGSAASRPATTVPQAETQSPEPLLCARAAQPGCCEWPSGRLFIERVTLQLITKDFSPVLALSITGGTSPVTPF